MKERIDKLDFIKIKFSCTVTDSVKKNEKISHRLGGNIFKRHI